MITPLKVKPRFNTTVVYATDLHELNVAGWRVIASRLTTSDTWIYPDGLIPTLHAMKRLRELGTIIMTQRRDGDHFTLLAKVSKDHAEAWPNLLRRELNKKAKAR